MNERYYPINWESPEINNLQQTVYQDSQNKFGINLYYIPLDDYEDTDMDGIWGEIQKKNFTSMYGIRMFLEDAVAMGGGADIFSKFGLDVMDEVVLYTTRKEFVERITGEELDPFNGSNIGVEDQDLLIDNGNKSAYEKGPKIHDLIYIPLWKSMFEITWTDANDWTIGGLKAFWKIVCRKYRVDIETDNINIADPGDAVSVDAEDKTNAAAIITDIEDKEIEKYKEAVDPTQTGVDENVKDNIINDNVNIEKSEIKSNNDSGDIFSDW